MALVIKINDQKKRDAFIMQTAPFLSKRFNTHVSPQQVEEELTRYEKGLTPSNTIMYEYIQELLKLMYEEQRLKKLNANK